MQASILEINENTVVVKVTGIIEGNLVNTYMSFQDTKVIIGEIIQIKGDTLYVNLVGEIKDNNFVYGITAKPSFNATISFIDKNNVSMIMSYPEVLTKSLFIGYSPIYDNLRISFDLNNFFSGHFAILGGSGSGKSWSLSKIIQNVFQNGDKVPYKASLFIFDTFGEYYNSFTGIEAQNPYISFKSYTTNLESNEEILKIPPFLLDVDDLAILLNANSTDQLQVLEKALSLVRIFKREDANILKIKNDIIARAILDILLSGRPSVQVRDQIFSILSFYKTSELNLDSVLTQPGYNRPLKHCLIIDADGKLREIDLLTDFFTGFLMDEKETNNLPPENVCYSLADLENAIDFALISEGMFKSEKVYENNNLLKVRMHTLVTDYYHTYFDYPNYITRENYINTLLTKGNRKAQLINININYVDDRFAKNIVKIMSKMLFDVLKVYKPRASFPVHIILEEAHRYVMNDDGVDLLGYNIFERISKEGRKYGILLGVISQRPSELSETSLSQSNNFLIFKMSHPKDLSYIKNLIPYMTDEIAKRIQVMQPGYCYAFGTAFKIPTILKIDKPNPTPESNNVDISNTWFLDVQKPTTTNTQPIEEIKEV